jgi:transcriptional regulator with XRE-family HTH domain
VASIAYERQAFVASFLKTPEPFAALKGLLAMECPLMSATTSIAQPSLAIKVKDIPHAALSDEPSIRELAHMTNATIGSTVKHHRLQARLSEATFADKLDEKRSFVRLVEAGRHPVTISEFKSLAKALDIDHMSLASDVFDQIEAASHALTVIPSSGLHSIACPDGQEGVSGDEEEFGASSEGLAP